MSLYPSEKEQIQENIIADLYQYFGAIPATEIEEKLQAYEKNLPRAQKCDEYPDFWRANQHLLDYTEDWNFDYSDLGYTEKPIF